jgi:hypothetical protein
MASWQCEPGSFKEALLFGASSAAVGFPILMEYSYFSIPPAHRTASMLQTDVLVALGIAMGVGLVGGVAFGLAQSWCRRRGRLALRGFGPWLPLALGGAHFVTLLAGLSVLRWLFYLGDGMGTAVTVALALGIPVGLSRLGWREARVPGVSLDLGP